MSRNWLFTTGPATVDSSSKTAQRWASTVAATGQIELNNYLFQLPAFSIPITNRNEGQYIIYQLNFTAPNSFTIFNWRDVIRQLPTDGGAQNQNYLLCIRYRVGNVVTRYALNPFSPANALFQSLYYPLYKGQVIKSNFCIEVWSLNNLLGLTYTTILTNPITFITSLKVANFMPEKIGSDVMLTPVSIAIGDIGNNILSWSLPMNNPQIQNAVGPFLSN